MWFCASCKKENLNERNFCVGCNSPKKDWDCTGCGYINFARNYKCKKCFKKKDEVCLSPAKPKFNPDWECRFCKYQNFSRNTKCKKCSKPKVFSDDSKWKCETCGSFNLIEQKACEKCYKDYLKQVSQNEVCEEKLCPICSERMGDQVLKDCGHLGFCLPCLLNHEERTCPVCRVPYQEDDIKKVYQVN